MEILRKIKDIQSEQDLQIKINKVLDYFNLSLKDLSSIIKYSPNYISACKQNQFKINDRFIAAIDLFVKTKELEHLLEIEKFKNNYK
ncbi:hypothetical protein [Campylobacter sp. RM12651]|uniref:hypothetical protein n=1 Tax=Campylobacter sp. RM12651 TaxID=1660079 RepID=UPI001EFAFFDC|nr:hypothetical protein [Campylobacter sp. RM12651]ULO03779.1 hypothetical protein AVBRAN_1325 [Campylobacter sp. RM12651]